jgi:hypothetical protein
MRPIVKRSVCGGLVLAALLASSSCATLTDMASVLANLQRLKFKIGSIRDFRLLGLDLSGKSKLADFSATDILKVAQSYSAKKLPVEFVMDVLAINPNDGTGGTRKTASTLTGLECRLLIDDKPTITGDIDSPVEIPGTGQESVIPLRLSLDLLEFFGGQRYEDLVAMALAIGGKNGSATRLSLDAQPTVSTPLGPITYPGRITIISAEFR